MIVSSEALYLYFSVPKWLKEAESDYCLRSTYTDWRYDDREWMFEFWSMDGNFIPAPTRGWKATGWMEDSYVNDGILQVDLAAAAMEQKNITNVGNFYW